jgi:hypothetical protein
VAAGADLFTDSVVVTSGATGSYFVDADADGSCSTDASATDSASIAMSEMFLLRLERFLRMSASRNLSPQKWRLWLIFPGTSAHSATKVNIIVKVVAENVDLFFKLFILCPLIFMNSLSSNFA